MKAWAILPALVLVACKARPAPPSLRIVSMRMLGAPEMTALSAGTYPMPPDAVLVVDPTHRTLFTRGLHDLVLEIEMGAACNPGAFVYVVHGPPLRPLTARDRNEIGRIARAAGAAVMARLPVRYGPDGRTPMVMRPVEKYEPKLPSDAEVHLTFPDLKTARAAASYIDKAYRVTTGKEGKGAFLNAAIRIPYGAVLDEQEAFAPLAARFGGKVAWSGGSSELP